MMMCQEQEGLGVQASDRMVGYRWLLLHLAVEHDTCLLLFWVPVLTERSHIDKARVPLATPNGGGDIGARGIPLPEERIVLGAAVRIRASKGTKPCPLYRL